MFERKIGTCWLAERRWRMSDLPSFKPVTKLIPSSSGPFRVQSSTWRTSSKKIGRWRFHGRGSDTNIEPSPTDRRVTRTAEEGRKPQFSEPPDEQAPSPSAAPPSAIFKSGFKYSLLTRP